MKYAIVANPVSGGIGPQVKRFLLREAAAVLDSEIYGLGARTAEEFIECAAKTARRCDVMVAAGGDGTLSMVVNAIDRSTHPVGFLPFGVGNAMRYALELRGSLACIASKIRDAPIRRFDLVDCGGKLAFSASVGIEAAALGVRRRHPGLKRGFLGYLVAALIAYFLVHRRISGVLDVDGVQSPVKRLLTLLVVKHPYLGFRMRVVPNARLHVLSVGSGFWRSIFLAWAAMTSSNRTGRYQTGSIVKASFDRPHALQADGEECWRAKTFTFKVLPGEVMMKA